MSRLFGTDGIRGVANEPPLTADLAYRVGRELAVTLATQHGGSGDDHLFGGKGHDFIKGGQGNDRIDGGPGFDWINDRDKKK